MGASLSHLASSLETLGTAIQVLRALNKQYRELLERSSSDPGLPPENSTDPYWLDCPPFPELVDVHSAVLPESADVVIVGSGIAAASVAWGLLMGGSDGQSRSSGDEEPAKDDTLGEKAGASSKSGSSKEVGSSSKDGGNSEARRQASVFPRIVVLEARAICSGATGRNGGHIKASPHEVFAALRRKLGARRAAELVRFQLRHLDTIVDLCRSGSEKRGSNHFEVAECREVETVDLLLDDKTVAEARHEVEMLRKWVPEFEIAVWSAKEAREVSLPSRCAFYMRPTKA